MNDLRPSLMAKRSSKKNSAVRIRFAAGLAAIVGLGSAVVTMASCTADEAALPRGIGNGTGGGSTTGGFVTTGGNVDPNKPCVDGTKAECHETVGNNGDILTCMHGERACVGGTWGPCTGEFSSQMLAPGQTPPSEEWAPGEYRALGLSDAGPCQNNPCDPYCQDFEETPGLDAGYQVIPTITTVWNTGSFDDYLQNIPPGFVNKGITWPCNTTSDCEFDSHCLPNGTNGRQCVDKGTTYAKCCMPWNPDEFVSCKSPPPNPVFTPDFTAGLACVMSDGKKVVPICNRGSVAVPSGSTITMHIWGGNAPSFPTCTPDKSADDCVYTLTQSLQPGKCVNADCSPYLPGNGNRTIMVNGPQASNGQYAGNANFKKECTCENNWTVWKGSNNNPCQPVQVYQANPIVKNLTYQGVCPPGTRVQWQYLTWDTTTPLDSSVLWRARVATTSGGLSAASYFALGTAKVTPTPDTHICSMVAPAGCPINLFNAFGGSPAANSEFLELEITMNPTSNLQQGAKVNNWQISYTCPPVQ